MLWLGLPGALAAACALAFLFARDNLDKPAAYVLAKGAPSLDIHCRRGARTFALVPGDAVQAGDELRFVPRPTSAEMRSIQVASIDGTGSFIPFYPARSEATSIALPPPGQPLTDSIRLDRAPGPERLFFVFSGTPLPVAAVREAVQAHVAHLSAPGSIQGTAVASGWIVLHKQFPCFREDMAITGLPMLFLLAARVAIVVSAENADGQPALCYAERDGERVAQVLGELGDFAQIVRLRQPSLRTLGQTLDAAEGRSAGDPNLEIFIYYSGHADETGLLLGRQRLTYPALRTRLERSHAAVRVAFLDACHTGSLVRPKGGTPAPGFALAAIEAPKVHGAAILAATSSHELAQESSAIEGSFFTHHLLSALRGAGDRDGNGMVTIAEAYQYAYDRTLSANRLSWGVPAPLASRWDACVLDGMVGRLSRPQPRILPRRDEARGCHHMGGPRVQRRRRCLARRAEVHPRSVLSKSRRGGAIFTVESS